MKPENHPSIPPRQGPKALLVLADSSPQPAHPQPPRQALAPLDVLAQVPEETLWLANFTSQHTRASYRTSVLDFIEAAGLSDARDFQRVSRAALIAWRDQLVREGKSIRTVKTRLSALSSLFAHLVKHGLVEKNVVREVDPPKLRVRRGETKALSSSQARKVLDAPPALTLHGLRDRAILAVGLQVGARREEIAKLTVEDFHEENGYPSLKLRRKGGAHGSVAIHQQAGLRIQAYLQAAGHAAELKSPLFRALRKNQLADLPTRHLHPRQIDRIFKRWARKAGLKRGFSSHSMRATCATTALTNGASLEQVQDLLGHANPATTKLYDRRGYNPEHSASFFATY